MTRISLPVLCLLVACTSSPAAEPKAAIDSLAQEMGRAQAVLAVMERRANGEKFVPRRGPAASSKSEPWEIRAEFGVAELRGGAPSLPPAVKAESKMTFTVLPNWGDTLEPEFLVTVCRGATCNRQEWPWECDQFGVCKVTAPASTLLGADAGRHLLTIFLQVKAGDVSQAMTFVAAAAGS